MNALPVLEQVATNMKNMAHWLTPQYRDDNVLADIADTIIRAAEELKTLREYRREKLAKDGPQAYYSHGHLVIVLLRDGKEKFLTFGEEETVKIDSTVDESVRTRYKMTEPSEDGQTYFIRATDHEHSRVSAIQVSKAEAVTLRQRLAEANATEFGDHDY